MTYQVLKHALRYFAEAEKLIEVQARGVSWLVHGDHGAPARVWRKAADWWRCLGCKRNGDDPCAHLVAVLFLEGIIPLPGDQPVPYKGDAKRPWPVLDEWEKTLPTELPALMHRLVETIDEPPAEPGPGRPPKPLRTLVFQTLVQAKERASLRASHGLMKSQDVTQYRGADRVNRSKLSLWKNQMGTLELFRFLLLQTTAMGRAYENTVHTDGTGFTPDEFTRFFEEKHHSKSERREHNWIIANIALTYKYNLVPAFVAHPKFVNERATFIPLLEYTRRVIPVQEAGADAGVFAGYNYEHTQREGIECTIKMPPSYEPGKNAGPAIRRQWALMKRDASWKKRANRRNNSEAGNHSVKARSGDRVRSRKETARQVDLAAILVVHNLRRLHLMSLVEKVMLDFPAGKQVVMSKPWVRLEDLVAQYARAPKKAPGLWDLSARKRAAIRGNMT